jgi:hypothetical protein
MQKEANPVANSPLSDLVSQEDFMYSRQGRVDNYSKMILIESNCFTERDSAYVLCKTFILKEGTMTRPLA